MEKEGSNPRQPGSQMGVIYHRKKMSCLSTASSFYMWKLRSCHTGGYALNIDHSDREGNFLPGKILVSYKRLVLQKITELKLHKLLKKLNQIF